MSSNQETDKNSIPLLLENLKKAYKKNIQGPIKYFEREYQATTKKEFLKEIAKFLKFNSVCKLKPPTIFWMEIFGLFIKCNLYLDRSFKIFNIVIFTSFTVFAPVQTTLPLLKSNNDILGNFCRYIKPGNFFKSYSEEGTISFIRFKSNLSEIVLVATILLISAAISR